MILKSVFSCTYFLSFGHFFHGSVYLTDLDPDSGKNVLSGQNDPDPKHCRKDRICFVLKLSIVQIVVNPDSVGSGTFSWF